MRKKCPNCDYLLVNPGGPSNAEILLVGEFPGIDEIRIGAPFVGKMGDILRQEMIRVGMNMYACRATNLWQHKENEECDIEWHKNQMIQEFRGRKFVFLMGSELTKMLFGKGVQELSGMEVPHELFPKIRFFAAPIPPYLGPVGEFRLAMEKFAKAVKK